MALNAISFLVSEVYMLVYIYICLRTYFNIFLFTGLIPV